MIPVIGFKLKDRVPVKGNEKTKRMLPVIGSKQNCHGMIPVVGSKKKRLTVTGN